MIATKDEREKIFDILGLDPDYNYPAISLDRDSMNQWLYRIDLAEQQLRLARSSQLAAWIAVILAVGLLVVGLQ